MSSEDRPIEFVSAKEEDQVSRNLLAWLNTFQGIPLSINLINYEFLDADIPSMSMSLVQSTYIIERFIHGPYIADYQFKIVYRAKPSTPDGRLSVDELLDSLGDWAAGQKPDIGGGLEVQTLEQTTRSSLFARMDGGWEDHQIFMRLTYLARP
ncbi:MAG: hypothetical protein HFF84_09720 [Oscillibacter sp.]|nr:hypothetical protein [Oscillibacter sp.]